LLASKRQFAVPADLLRGSFVQRFTTCGKANCVCAQGQRHGPFYYLVSNLAPGHIWQMGHRRWGVENHAFNELIDPVLRPGALWPS
jgi:Family of unknown function (DUF6788)